METSQEATDGYKRLIFICGWNAPHAMRPFRLNSLTTC